MFLDVVRNVIYNKKNLYLLFAYPYTEHHRTANPFRTFIFVLNFQTKTMNYNFKHVNYLWDEQKAASLGDNQVALFLYRSNMLGSDLRITNYGGGNTSCKTIENCPVTNEEVEVMWIKGSGGDIGTLKRSGIAGLYNDKLRDLKKVYRGLEHEDEMVAKFNYCLFDLNSAAPSIDTPLHGMLPFKHIDHLHPDALIAIAAAADGEAIAKEIWGDKMGWVPWQRPGFDLGLQLEKCLADNPNIKGIILGSHGLFTWGDTAHECYVNSLETIEQAAEYIAQREGKNRPVFGGQIKNSLAPELRKEKATSLMPILRGLCSSEQAMVGHFDDGDKVLQFINSEDLGKLAPLGTSCPDHFLRTKIQPLVIDLPTDGEHTTEQIIEKLTPAFEQYRKEYSEYYNNCKKTNSPAMRDPNPVIILWPSVGMFSFAKNKQTARVASEFYVNAINVMRGAEAISTYTSLPRQEAFDIEYWLLEEAKLQRMPKEKMLSRRVALVTGAGGGIGQAIAQKLLAEGANVVFTDLKIDGIKDDIDRLGKDNAIAVACDVTSEASINNAINQAVMAFGGVDLIVHSAGLAISKSLTDTSLADWNLLYDVMVKGQFLVSKAAFEVMKKQNMGGDIINIASKNGMFAGPNNVAYGSAKASQQHITRLLAAELGANKVRVNTVNPDGVIVGSKIWEGEWAEGRAKAYGIKVEELPAFYAKRNILNEIILPEDIANGVAALLSLKKCTGNTLNVDGGVAASFSR
jgi:rhamnulose-1-phosphate aldolase/alcohol dehydrogenase